MSSLSQFAGGDKPPTSIVHSASVAGWGGVANLGTTGAANAGGKTILSGALTANTLATILSITGAGSVQYLDVISADATSRTIRVEITVDGVVVYDFTSAAIATASAGRVLIGMNIGGANSVASLESLNFKSSFAVRVASSLSETDKVYITTRYWTK